MDQYAKAHKKTTLEATVIRCGCPKDWPIEAKLARHGVDPVTGAIGVCPTPRKTRRLGLISYTNDGHPIQTALITAWIWIHRQLINDR